MVEIKIGDQVYGGWKTARIERGIEQIAGSFELSVSERWAGQDVPRRIRRGERCTILADGETVITGWVDDVAPSYSADAHEFRVMGRDATGDLVDCSAIYKTGQWSRVKLDRIVHDICEPFKIPVAVEVDVGKAIPDHRINEGESAFECIERACRMQAVMPVSDGKGGLVLTRAKDGESVADLIEGVNILSAKGEFGMKERHSRYVVKGQDRGSDDDFETPETHTQVKAESVDDQVLRYRPLVVLAESRGPHATYKDRATWERNVRRGRSSVATVTVRGWRNAATGQLWQPNTMVHLVSSWLGVDAYVLVVAVTFTLDEERGFVSALRLSSRDAFDLIVGKKTPGLKGKIRESKSREKSLGTDWSTF